MINGINLYPNQSSAVDSSVTSIDVPDEELPPPETFMDPSFTKDEEAYAQDALFPSEAVSMKVIGRILDVNVVQVDIAPALWRFIPAEPAWADMKMGTTCIPLSSKPNGIE